MDHSSQHEENEQRASTQREKSLQQKNEENKVADKPAWEAEKTSEPRNEVSKLEYPGRTILALR